MKKKTNLQLAKEVVAEMEKKGKKFSAKTHNIKIVKLLLDVVDSKVTK